MLGHPNRTRGACGCRLAGGPGWALALALLLGGGCGSGGESGADAGPDPEEAQEPEPVPSAADAYALDPQRLARIYAEADDRAAAGEGDAAAAAHAEAARLARVLALRERDGEWLGRARRHLSAATRRRDWAGACQAGLALARLGAVDASDPTVGYADAYRTLRRFEGEGEEREACLAEARRMLAILESFRPAPTVLARIDAAPDADAEGDEGAGSEDPLSVARWAEGREDLGRARLEHVAVYGAADGSDEVGVVRLVLRFDRVAVFRRGEVPAESGLPRRAYLDLDQTEVGEGVARTTQVGGAGLQRVRVGPHRPGLTRVVFDLTDDAHYALFFLSDPYRIVVDFDRRERAVVEPTRTPGEARPLDVIVLDPGHGGDEFGARQDGMKESVLTLDITERVARILRRRVPRLRVLLTRHTDDIVSLEERVAFANAAGADAFVSIHLNAADDPVEHGGVTTFVLDTADDGQALALAARENGTSANEVSGLSRLLASIHREGQLTESRALAALVQRGTLAGGRRVLSDLPDRGVKSAMFYVLVGARMPAVLLEASFLTQPEEARALATPRYREALAEGIAEGIVRYGRGG